MRVCLLLVALCAAARAEFLLDDGDRVVFLGDSITAQRLYTRYVQQYIYCRYPEKDIRFFNAGVGGDTAKRALDRLDRDVFWLQPTVVTVCFGMNDGLYRAPDKKIAKAYKESLGALVKALRARKLRVVVLSPGCVDPDRRPKNPAYQQYNDTLKSFAKIAEGVARRHKCGYVNLFKPMLAYQQSRKREDPKWTMIPDAVHPGAEGHYVMARWVLVGLKAEAMAGLGSFDRGKGAGKGLVLVAQDEKRLVLQTEAPVAVPFWYPRGVAGAVERCGLVDFYIGSKLEVKGLDRGDYYVSVNSIECGRFKSNELIRGVGVHGFDTLTGKRIHDLAEIRAAHYHDTWLKARLRLAHLEEHEKVVKGLMEAMDGYHAMIRAQARKAVTLRIEITASPEGPNLALRARYQSSDPNPGWGKGGLTDGDWSSNSKHCFSTGMSFRFPKTVLIDLGERHTISCIRMGVPPFGSTKNVRIEISKKSVRFRKVAEREFLTGREQRATFWFKPVEGRYLKLTYLDHHQERTGFPPQLVFATELEVFEK